MDVKASKDNKNCWGPIDRIVVRIGFFEKRVHRLRPDQWHSVDQSFAMRVVEDPLGKGRRSTFMSNGDTRCTSGIYKGYGDGYFVVNGQPYASFQPGWGPESDVVCK